MKTTSKSLAPSASQIASELGTALDLWHKVIELVSESVGTIEQEWKASKSDFGHMCLLRHKKRTLLYMTPEKNQIRVAIVLGERAVGIALASALPECIKALIRDARPFVEGRGIRFAISSLSELSIVIDLIAIKMMPK